MPFDPEVTISLESETPAPGLEVVKGGVDVTTIALLEYPAGAQARLKIGNNPPFTITGPFVFELCGEDGRRGIRVIVPAAQPGVELTFFVGFSDGPRVVQ